MFKDSLSRVVKTWNRMSLIQKVFIVVALVTVLCSICTDCLLCKHWPVKVPMSASMAPSVSASMRSVSQSAENFQNQDAGAGKIVLYYVPWCPHCKNMMPEWNKLMPPLVNIENPSNNMQVIALLDLVGQIDTLVPSSS